MDDRIERVTPELALVDPILAAAARAHLPDPGDCLVVRRRPAFSTDPVAPAFQRELRALGPERQPRVGLRLPVRRVATAAVWLLPVLVVGSSLLAFIPPGGSSRPRFLSPARVEVPAPTESGARPPVALRIVSGRDGRIAIRWPPDSTAAFYHLVLLGGGKRIDLWPNTNSAEYVADLVAPRPHPSRIVLYRWFVYPGYQSASGPEIGRALAHGVVVTPGPADSGASG